MPNEVDKILEERAKTHGSFRAHAGLCQSMKQACREHARLAEYSERPISPAQWEAIDMILHKVARAIVGNANHVDHWDDIQGYAKLVADELRATYGAASIGQPLQNMSFSEHCARAPRL